MEISQREDFKNLPESGKERVVNENIVGLATYIEARTGYKPQMTKSVAENVQEFISAKAKVLYPESRLAQLALVALILVVTVKSVEFLLFPVLALLGLLLYELLLGFGFAEIQFESRSKEMVNLPSRRS